MFQCGKCTSHMTHDGQVPSARCYSNDTLSKMKRENVLLATQHNLTEQNVAFVQAFHGSDSSLNYAETSAASQAAELSAYT